MRGSLRRLRCADALHVGLCRHGVLLAAAPSRSACGWRRGAGAAAALQPALLCLHWAALACTVLLRSLPLPASLCCCQSARSPLPSLPLPPRMTRLLPSHLTTLLALFDGHTDVLRGLPRRVATRTQTHNR